MAHVSCVDDDEMLRGLLRVFGWDAVQPAEALRRAARTAPHESRGSGAA